MKALSKFPRTLGECWSKIKSLEGGEMIEKLDAQRSTAEDAYNKINELIDAVNLLGRRVADMQDIKIEDIDPRCSGAVGGEKWIKIPEGFEVCPDCQIPTLKPKDKPSEGLEDVIRDAENRWCKGDDNGRWEKIVASAIRSWICSKMPSKSTYGRAYDDGYNEALKDVKKSLGVE